MLVVGAVMVVAYLLGYKLQYDHDENIQFHPQSSVVAGKFPATKKHLTTLFLAVPAWLIYFWPLPSKYFIIASRGCFRRQIFSRRKNGKKKKLLVSQSWSPSWKKNHNRCTRRRGFYFWQRSTIVIFFFYDGNHDQLAMDFFSIFSLQKYLTRKNSHD